MIERKKEEEDEEDNDKKLTTTTTKKKKQETKREWGRQAFTLNTEVERRWSWQAKNNDNLESNRTEGTLKSTATLRRQRLQEWTMSIGRTLRVHGRWDFSQRLNLIEVFGSTTDRRLALWEKHKGTPNKNDFVFVKHCCANMFMQTCSQAQTPHIGGWFCWRSAATFLKKTWGSGTPEEPGRCARTKAWKKNLCGTS